MPKGKPAQQSAFNFAVEVRQVERNIVEREKPKREEMSVEKLGLNYDWKNFGDYIKKVRGNKL